MRKALFCISWLLLWFVAAPRVHADSTWEFSVQASATVRATPAQITLSWPQDTYIQPNSYTVYRKAPADTSWGTGTALPGTATSFTDNNVSVGTAYEYQIVKVTSQYTGYGYVYAGINVPLTENRGKLLLVVDNTYAAALSNELGVLQSDLAGDGWSVVRLNVNRTDSVVSVKNQIVAQYNADPANVKTVFLFGHVPVPYSGDIVPDGHVPDHQGAWPCDGYYGDMTGTWTDSSVNDSSGTDARNHNVPGDGKFDQSTFPAPIKLMVGRVDLANLPGRLTWGGPATFPSEQELLRNYLNKDHKFRTKQFDLPRTAILGDFFGVRNGEAFAASGWRNYASFFGASNLVNEPNMGTWVPALHSTAALCAYGCGAGSFTSIAGLGNADSYNDTTTTEVYSNDLKSAFCLVFGSWLGDWDSEDNVMRTMLALPSYGLASAWSGRPHWFLQHMALGETIGYGARLTQNNGAGGLYQNQINSAAGMIHIALMGDPTLRLHSVAPPANLTGVTNGTGTILSWTPSIDSIIGYHVYRATNSAGPFTRLTSSPITATTFTDNSGGAANYMVRAVKLETSGSGTYYNGSEGIFLTPAALGSTTVASSGDSDGGNPVTTTNSTTTASTTVTNDVPWVDDALPAGGVGNADGGDSWSWITSNPSPVSGTLAHQSAVASGLHEHYFAWASSVMNVSTGDQVYAYVYLDPANPPSELMLQWYDGTWEHRAYWGANSIINGTDGTVARQSMGAVPAAGQWVRLQLPASRVGLEGSTVSGMAFSLYGGRATWDNAGKTTLVTTNTTSSGSGSSTNSTSSGGSTNTASGGSGSGTTNLVSGSGTNGSLTQPTNGLSVVDGTTLKMPPVGANTMHVLSPNLVELVYVNTKAADPATVSTWNLVNGSAQLLAPPLSAFAVTVNGLPVTVLAVGFKRRPLYAPLAGYDLRIENSLYLQLSAPVSDNDVIQVTNPDGSLWSSSTTYSAKADPLRYSPAIHVNQEGYMPNYAKVAMVGYYLGSMGEMTIPASSGFKIVDANTGAQVYQGNLVQRADSGFAYTPTPYQKVYQADFTAFNTPGQYRLVVPGMGASLPFLINDGVGMDFARAYALGLYHQRCGTNLGLPYTRFTHADCHAAAANVIMPASSYAFSWNTISNYALTLNANNPPQVAPALTGPSAQLFPLQRQGAIDVSGGHHDAGDYSKYTINSASLIHYLMFSVDSLNGVAALDNLGIPESGDGISDVMQEAKWEADFLAKMQDTDGGFYFLVYPQNREYEGDVTPDHGDAQVVWPKTTSVTAASVAALAQCASSPLFKQTYPQAAALYLQKAQLGWQFLTNAIARYGKNGAYQKITHYGDNFADNDELAWAACQIFLATGDQTAHQYLLNWFDPSDPATWHWGWWHMSECYGHAIRSYAFAVQSGRVASTNALNASFLAKCQAQIAAAGDDMMNFSQQSAYGTSMAPETKAAQSPGWYFSCDQAFDLVVAYQLNPKQAYIDTLVANMNYEGGCNPVNVTFVSGLGWKRQRTYVSQWQLNDKRTLPPSGLPIGNVQTAFGYLWNYQAELEELCFPSDSASTALYPFYDRWGDSWNVSTEMVVLNQARGLGALAFLAAMGPYKTQAWKAPAATITVPSGVAPVGSNVTLTLNVPGMDLTGARVVWEATSQEPSYGATLTYAPSVSGTQWVEAEAQWPDGRRAFAAATFSANSPDIVWVDDSLPAGATAGADGGDSWNWVNNPTPESGTLAHQSAAATGEHQQFFTGATTTLSVGTGDVMYAWVYLNPLNPPTEVELQWNDGSSWEHRAYWGVNTLGFGVSGTASRYYAGALPPTGQWVQLKVPANAVGLEGATVSGMAFTLYGGQATWDAAGRLSQISNNTSTNGLNISSLKLVSGVPTLTWNSVVGGVYQVNYKNSLNATSWQVAAGSITATNTVTTWRDTNAVGVGQRFYRLHQTQ